MKRIISHDSLDDFLRSLIDSRNLEEKEETSNSEVESYSTGNAKWAIVTNTTIKDKTFTTLIIQAPFAIQDSVRVKFSTDDKTTTTINIKFSNNSLSLIKGNFDIPKTQEATIYGFKKIDRKSVKIKYENGIYTLIFSQIDDDSSQFVVGLSK